MCDRYYKGDHCEIGKYGRQLKLVGMEKTVRSVSMRGNCEICMRDNCEISEYGRQL